MTTPLLYLGPEGTFTHQAACALSTDDDTLVTITDTDDIFDRLATDPEADAVLPFENSREGPVPWTFDRLAEPGHGLCITGRHDIDVSFVLYRRPGDRSPVREVIGHPVAMAQCGAFIRGRGWRTHSATSASVACLEMLDRTGDGWGAIGTPMTGRFIDLDAERDDIADRDDLRTRFVRLSHRPGPAGAVGAFMLRLEPGTLGAFGARLSRLGEGSIRAMLSRPRGDGLGRTALYLETDRGGAFEEPAPWISVLGSFDA